MGANINSNNIWARNQSLVPRASGRRSAPISPVSGDPETNNTGKSSNRSSLSSILDNLGLGGSSTSYARVPKMSSPDNKAAPNPAPDSSGSQEFNAKASPALTMEEGSYDLSLEHLLGGFNTSPMPDITAPNVVKRAVSDQRQPEAPNPNTANEDDNAPKMGLQEAFRFELAQKKKERRQHQAHQMALPSAKEVAGASRMGEQYSRYVRWGMRGRQKYQRLANFAKQHLGTAGGNPGDYAAGVERNMQVARYQAAQSANLVNNINSATSHNANLLEKIRQGKKLY